MALLDKPISKEAASPVKFIKDSLSRAGAQKLMTAGSLAAGGGAGYLHHRSQKEGKKNPIFPIITALGTAWSTNPKYVRRTLENIRHARSIKGAETQMPFLKALGTSAGLTLGSKGVEVAANTADRFEDIGENIRSTTESLRIDPEKGGADINKITGTLMGAADKIGKVNAKDIFREGAQEMIGGVTKGVKDQAIRAKDWASENTGKVAAGAIGLAGLYALYKFNKNRERRQKLEEEATIQELVRRRIAARRAI